MFSKTNKKEKLDTEQREQYEYARKRIQQKKGLMRHFIVFLVGCILLIIINPVLGYGNEFFIPNWFVWAILIWTFLFLIHVFNVFLMNKFMGKEWEHEQLEKLKRKQEVRIAELKQQAVKEVRSAKEIEAIDTEATAPDIKKNDPNQLPPEQA